MDKNTALQNQSASIGRDFGKTHLKECTFVLDPASFHYAVTS